MTKDAPQRRRAFGGDPSAINKERRLFDPLRGGEVVLVEVSGHRHAVRRIAASAVSAMLER